MEGSKSIDSEWDGIRPFEPGREQSARCRPKAPVGKFVAKPIRHAYHGAMKRAVILSLIMIWALVASGSAPARADDNADANRLMVETVGLLKQTRAEIDPEHQFELITMVEANLLRIIDEYPGSNAAVALATGQGIG
ncbi:MAG: hypothetical protein ACTSQ7_17305, partial [Alphaproteobacteria bacterium]